MAHSPERSQRIVVGIDGPRHSARPLQVAASLAAALGARLEVVNCWLLPDVDIAAQIPRGGPGLQDQLEFSATQGVEEALDRAFGPERPGGLSVRIRCGHPAQVLVSESTNARMLVVGRRGQGGFLGLRIGSVSSACVTHASCPVLVVNEPG